MQHWQFHSVLIQSSQRLSPEMQLNRKTSDRAGQTREPPHSGRWWMHSLGEWLALNSQLENLMKSFICVCLPSRSFEVSKYLNKDSLRLPPAFSSSGWSENICCRTAELFVGFSGHKSCCRSKSDSRLSIWAFQSAEKRTECPVRKRKIKLQTSTWA